MKYDTQSMGGKMTSNDENIGHRSAYFQIRLSPSNLTKRGDEYH